MAREGLLDGYEELVDVLHRGGYPSILHALAAHTVFVHPETVRQTRGHPVFRVIRAASAAERGRMVAAHDGGRAMLDDNTAPTDAFLWSVDRGKGRDVQFNHIWQLSKEVRYYTALWNLCATPAFLAKVTDSAPAAVLALRRRAYDLYGHLPDGETVPNVPPGYVELVWRPSPPPIADLESVLRERLARRPKSRTAASVRECGWVFSDFQPDPSVVHHQ